MPRHLFLAETQPATGAPARVPASHGRPQDAG